jgi:hypothetical protein
MQRYGIFYLLIYALLYTAMIANQFPAEAPSLGRVLRYLHNTFRECSDRRSSKYLLLPGKERRHEGKATRPRGFGLGITECWGGKV